MGVALRINEDRRTGDRLEVDRHAVLRLGDRVEPIMLEDLTAGGCRFQCDAKLEPFAAISIGIAGVGHTPARVAWQRGPSYGCAFDRPLPGSAVTPAAPENIARMAAAASAWQHVAEDAQDASEVPLLSLRTRFAIISGLTVSLWTVIIGLAALAF